MALHYSPVSLLKGLRVLFNQALSKQPLYAKDIATIAPSDANQENYGWLGETPAITQWLTERKIRGMQDAKYTIVNSLWEGTIGVKRTDLEDDQLGALPIRIKDLAYRAATHANALLIKALINGTDATLGLCHDGGAFFSTTHALRGEQATQNTNMVIQSGTTASAIQADLNAAIAAMMNMVDEAGEPAREMLSELTVLCGPNLQLVMKTVLHGAIISQTSNVMVGAANLIVSPRLSGNAWYLLHTGSPLRPLIFQDRVPVTFESLENQSESSFLRDIWMYGTRARYNVGYGLYYDAVKVS